MLETVRQIGPYRIVRPLGKGGMAEVYEVEFLRKRNQVSQAKTRIGRMVAAIEGV